MRITSNTRKLGICLAIAFIVLAAVTAPALASQAAKSHGNSGAKAQATPEVTAPAQVIKPTQAPVDEALAEPANGAPALPVRYAVVESKVNLTIGEMADIVKLVPQASDLNAHIDILSSDLQTLNTYVASNDTTGFNRFIKDTLHPDMLNASKAILTDTKQFKEWGVTKDTVAQLKKDTKQLHDDYNVGAHVSAVARNDNSEKTHAYLNKAGIQVHGKQTEAPVTQGKAHGPKAAEEAAAGST